MVPWQQYNSRRQQQNVINKMGLCKEVINNWYLFKSYGANKKNNEGVSHIIRGENYTKQFPEATKMHGLHVAQVWQRLVENSAHRRKH